MKKTKVLLASAVDISERMNLTVAEFEHLIEKIADKTLDSAIAVEEFAYQVQQLGVITQDIPKNMGRLSDVILDAEVRIADTPVPIVPTDFSETGRQIALPFDEEVPKIPKRNFEEIFDSAMKITDTFDALTADLSNAKLGISGFDTKAAGFENATLEEMPERLREFDDIMRLSLDELVLNVADESKRLREAFDAGTISSEEYKAAMTKIQESDDLIDSMTANLGAYKDLAKGIELLAEELSEYAEAFQKASERAGQKMSDVVWAGLRDIPGGQFVGELLGVDKLAENLTRAGEQGIVGVVNAMRTDGVSGLMALTKGARAFGKSLYAALGPIGLITAAVGALIALTVSHHKQVKEVSKEFGVSRSAAAELHEEMLGIVSSTEGVLGGMDTVQATMKAMMTEFGTFKVQPLEPDLMRDIVNISGKFGIAADDMGRLNAELQQSGASGEVAANIQAAAIAAADAAGISPSLITKDMIDNAELLSSVYYGMPEAFAEATLEARKMGMSIGQAKKVADSLLDIESSLTAQFEMSAVLGRNIDLSRARDLALQDDYLGMMKEVTSNMATQQEFASMTRYERQLMAKGLGMETQELANIYHFQKLSKNLTEEEQALYEKYKGTLGDISGMNAEQLREETARLDTLDQMDASWNSMKATLGAALLPLAEAFTNVISSLTPILKLVGFLLKGLVPVVKLILTPFTLIGEAIKFISDGIEKVVSSLGVGGEMSSNISSIATTAMTIGGAFLIGFKPVVKMIGWISGQFSNMGNVIRGIFGMEQKQNKLLDVHDGMSNRKQRRRTQFNQSRSKAMNRSLKANIVDEVVSSTAGCGCDSGVGGMSDYYGGDSAGKRNKKNKGKNKITTRRRRSPGAKGRWMRMKGKRMGRGVLGKLGGIAALGASAIGAFGGGSSDIIPPPAESLGALDVVGGTASTVDTAADVASAGKSVGGKIGKKAGKSALGKGLGKVGAKVAGKGMLKAMVKKIPIVGAVAGGAFAIQRLMQGDFMGAGLEMLSGVASIIPGVGTAVSVGLDAALAAKDIAQANKESKTASEQINDSAAEISDKIATATDAYISPFDDISTPEEMDKALASMTLANDVTSPSELGERAPSVTSVNNGVELPSDGALQREYQNEVIMQDNTQTHIVTHTDPEMKRKYDEMIAAIKASSNKKSQVNIGDDEVRRMNRIIRQQNGV